jgi:hypothetical protein
MGVCIEAKYRWNERMAGRRLTLGRKKVLPGRRVEVRESLENMGAKRRRV